MEGVGLYAAAQKHGVDWILAKSVCDWADGKKRDQERERQRKAARNAAACVLDVLERGRLDLIRTEAQQ
jgi:nucleoside phosphorylase